MKDLLSEWQGKAVLTLGAFIATETFKLHAVLLAGFGILEFLDCFTKWLAISYEMLTEDDPGMHPSLWLCFKSIPEARRQRRIRSEEMRTLFCSKFLKYVILVIASAVADYMLKATQQSAPFLTIVISYICAVEILSVLENLADSGVQEAGRLIEIINLKLGGKK